MSYYTTTTNLNYLYKTRWIDAFISVHPSIHVSYVNSDLMFE